MFNTKLKHPINQTYPPGISYAPEPPNLLSMLTEKLGNEEVIVEFIK